MTMSESTPPLGEKDVEKQLDAPDAIGRLTDDGARGSASSSDHTLTSPPGEAANTASQLPPAQSEIPERDPDFIVSFGKDDPKNPKNFPTIQKAWMTFVMGLLAFSGSLGSAITTPAETTLSKHFHVDTEVTVLTMSLFVLGFALGPVFWAPISEAYGRRWSMLPPVCVLALFSIGTATSKNIAAVLVTRFFGGIFGSAPVSNVAAAMGDIFTPENRGLGMSFYAICVVGGPALSPVVGAAITVNKHMGWRWTEYMEAIIAVVIVLIAFFTMPETYAPVLLERKAKALRKTTGDQRYWHPHEDERMTVDNVVTKHLSRPIRMLLTEPIVSCVALYASFIYGLMFLLLEVFPIVFLDHRHMGTIVAQLPFLGILVGVMTATPLNIAAQPFYRRAMQKNKGRAVPEARSPLMAIGGLFFSVGMFWFGWTAKPSDSWVLPTIAAGFIGCGFTIAFQQCLNTLVDTYASYAASATSANTILRSLMACGLPLAARPMFLNMGVAPAASVLGGISCLALPVPFLLAKYGRALRKRSKFAKVYDD